MTVELHLPAAPDLEAIIREVGEWHSDAVPFQLHPGDIGWFGRHGDERTAAGLRTWHRDGRLMAVGLLDGPGLLRVGIAPDAFGDADLATVIANDIDDDDGRVLPSGTADVEIPATAALREALDRRGWGRGEAWTHLRRDLGQPVDSSTALRVETVDEGNAHVRTAVHRAAFGSGAFTDERWRSLAHGPAYVRARCLLGYDGGSPVAAVTVWSAGEGRPGVIEPMGVHPEHRGRGHGAAITVAAAAALAEMGASSARVGTPTDNVAAVATYVAAEFEPWAEVADHRRASERVNGDTTPRTE